jgi:hypothetical protein
MEFCKEGVSRETAFIGSDIQRQTVLFYVKQPHAKELAEQPLFHVKQALRMNKEMN